MTPFIQRQLRYEIKHHCRIISDCKYEITKMHTVNNKEKLIAIRDYLIEQSISKLHHSTIGQCYADLLLEVNTLIEKAN